MRAVPLTLAQANDVVSRLHRHHKPVIGHRFSIGCEVAGKLVGCVISGRPVARKLDQNRVFEVTRLATDGTPHACSFLYARAARAAEAMGADEIRTAILGHEPGTSLKAAGWTFSHTSPGRSWNVPSRGGRNDDARNLGPKQIWVRRFARIAAEKGKSR